MALKKERGIVIHSYDFGDSDRVISVAGEFQVRLKFISKGIRKSQRRPIAATELGSLIDLDFYDQTEKDWKSIKEMNLVNRFDGIKSSYRGTYFIFYLCELCSYLYPEGESHPFLFQLLNGSFDYCEKEGFAFELLPFFKLRALANLGHFPSEFRCVTCGMDILEKKAASLSLESREFLCGDCHTLPKNQIVMIRLFNSILKIRFSQFLLQKPKRETVKEADLVLNQFLRSITGHEMKSYFEFYKTLGDS